MSSGKNRVNLMEELARELRQFNGLGAAFFRAVAGRIGMNVTDTQVIDLLNSNGPMTAGQLADLTELTTGAITGMLNRLEESGLVRRERDPNDGRRVIIRLVKGQDETYEVSNIFGSIAKAWDELASQYSDEQIAFLLEFIKQSNTISRKEINRLREAPSGKEGVFSAPLGDLKSARLVISSGLSRLNLGTDPTMTDLYQARFEGPVPDVKAKDGVVNIRYPRRLWVMGGGHRASEVTLSMAIPWQIVLQGGAAEVHALLDGLDLAVLEVKGGLNIINLELPKPSGMVPIRISGGASEVKVQRPAGVAARVRLKGWASNFVFDDQRFSGVGNDVRLQSPGFEATAPGYDIEVSSSVSSVSITTA